MKGKKIRNLRAGVFIDGSNLFWAMKEVGWELDFNKFKNYLKKRFSPIFYNYYDCEDVQPRSEKFIESAKRKREFHNKLHGIGYNIKKKPLKYIRDKETGKIKTKGDLDVEITIAVKNSLKDLDVIILVSGDSDFFCAVEDSHCEGKYIRIFSFDDFLSWELKNFAFAQPRCSYKLLDELKSDLEYYGNKNTLGG